MSADRTSDTTGEATGEATGEPFLRIVRGNPTEDELAAVVIALMALGRAHGAPAGAVPARPVPVMPVVTVPPLNWSRPRGRPVVRLSGRIVQPPPSLFPARPPSRPTPELLPSS